MEHIYLVLCSSASMHVGSPHSAIPLDASSVPAMLYFPCMNETEFEERFDRLKKHLESVAKQIDVLARATEREFRDLHHSINHRFERVSARLETIEARIEVFSRRMDYEVEQRHKLAERVANLERSV